MNDTHTLSDGLHLIVKRDCPTCTLIAPIIPHIRAGMPSLTTYTQDDPTFPAGVDNLVDDTALKHSYDLNIETVPTLLRVEDGKEAERIIGWHRAEWQAFTGIAELGADLPEMRPGCGAKNVEPGIAEKLAALYGGEKLAARRVALAPLEDDMEACYERGWSDGLPVVPPTPERVLQMLDGTTRAPQEIVGVIPPNNAECTVEKVAINAVLAGCKPEYLPVVLAAVEAACIDEFCMHGVLATTWFSSPVVIVNGPITKAIGMNSGVNALGQGHRANATVGRALQLVIRNVGGGKPGGVDRSTLGNPGKYTFCFAENEDDSPWEPLSVERGFAAGTSTVTLFAGDGVQGIFDQTSRTPELLAQSFAACLRAVAHPNLALASDAVLVVSPEHARVFREASWNKAQLRESLDSLLMLPTAEVAQRQNKATTATIPKFRPGGLQIVHAGGKAGMFSAIIAGWLGSGPRGSQPVTQVIAV